MEQKKILIADDEQDILDVLGKRIVESNYDVVTISDGREVIDKCKSAKPDLIILDIVMPGMNGYAVASMLRKERNLAGIPIIFMTAKELEYSGIQKRLSDLGFCDFIAKPFTFEELLAKIKEKID